MKSKKTLFALPLLLGALILSCQDEMSGRLEDKVQDAAINAAIEKAKAIFEQKSPDFPVIQSRSADGVEKGIVFEPTWGELSFRNIRTVLLPWKRMCFYLNHSTCRRKILKKHTKQPKIGVICNTYQGQLC